MILSGFKVEKGMLFMWRERNESTGAIKRTTRGAVCPTLNAGLNPMTMETRFLDNSFRCWRASLSVRAMHVRPMKSHMNNP